jgi:hypothetical protein
MELFVGLVVIAVAIWLWKSRQADKQTMLDFDAWVHRYETASSAFKRSRMAIAFLNQSIHYAREMGAINSKQQAIIISTLKQQQASTTLTIWFGSALPAVERAVGFNDVANTPARAIGMLMLLAWMAPATERENAVRQFLFRR